jgi:hypothetical protein
MKLKITIEIEENEEKPIYPSYYNPDSIIRDSTTRITPNYETVYN